MRRCGLTLAACIACSAGVSGAATAWAAKTDVPEAYIYSSGGAPAAPGAWAGDVSTSSGELTPPVLKFTPDTPTGDSLHEAESAPPYSIESADAADLAAVIAASDLDGFTAGSGSPAWAYLRTGLFALILVNAALLYWLLLGHRWMMRAAQSAKREIDPHRTFRTSV